MDFAGMLIAISSVIMISALVVTVYGGQLARLFRKVPPKSESGRDAAFAELPAIDDLRQPAVGDLNIPLPAMNAVGDLNIPLPAMRTVLGTVRE